MAQERDCMDFTEPPPIDAILDAVKHTGDRPEGAQKVVTRAEETSSSTHTGTNQGVSVLQNCTNQAPSFSISEFARLILVMRDDERARTALFKLNQELQRAELDGGVSRDCFWGIISDRFNDRSLPVRFDFSCEVEDIDPSQPPPCFRSTSSLKAHFQDARSTFTTALANWSTSGQNNPKS